tara:strand:+ start:5274 stop:5384 length:111 start_codon:yes stop_codon:yes gene_type:complete
MRRRILNPLKPLPVTWYCNKVEIRTGESRVGKILAI